ncbi:DUF971 domain-containing protein [Paraburkholderia phenoliruptrix]|uniref:DUF971 domain-containing protein n=1 Tax=Paraburkholderia phenoliruptrix TaxID=252970 RepID=UPI0001C01CE5
MNVPDSVAIDAVSGTLSMRWPDGSAAQLPSAGLRAACLCAACRKLKLDGLSSLSRADVKLLDARPTGYGLQLVFDDGHERGIFPWAYLERMAKGELD